MLVYRSLGLTPRRPTPTAERRPTPQTHEEPERTPARQDTTDPEKSR